MTILERTDKLNIIGIIIRLWAFLIAAFHTLLVAFRYVVVVPNYLPLLQWAGVGLVLATVLYLLIFSFHSQVSRRRIVASFRKVISPELYLLTAVLVWFILSSVINQLTGEKRYLRMEDAYLFDMAVCIYILYPMANAQSGKNTGKLPELLIHLVAILYSIFTAFCLWHIFHLEVLTFPSGEQGGFTEKVQLILGAHYNLTGMIAITMFCLCIYMVFTQEAVIKVLYVFLGLIQLAAIYLSNSRTIFVGLIVFAATIGFFWPWKTLYKKKSLIRLGASLLICVSCVGLFWAGRTGTFVLFENITHFSEELANEKEAEGLSDAEEKYRATGLTSVIPYETANLSKTGADNVRKLNNLSNRTKVWAAAIKVMGSSPQRFLFGVTSFGVTDAIRDIGGYHKEDVAHAHNIILQIGISMGVPAMILFLVFLLIIALRCMRILIRSNGINSYLIPSIILCFTVINMGESYLAGYYSVMACFFYLFCGWITEIDKRKNND